jgi:hypothetical protein
LVWGSKTRTRGFDTIVDENKPSAVRVLRVEGSHFAKGKWDVQSLWPHQKIKTAFAVFIFWDLIKI